MSGNAMKSDLSVARRRLVELMQRLDFGTVEGLRVQAGEPVFDPPPRVVRDVKFGPESAPRPARGGEDYALKSQVVDLLRLLDEVGSGTIESITVLHGLPFRARLGETIAPR
jgi:hypothetical protein